MKNERIYFWAMLTLTVASIAYWSNFVILKYTMFKYPYSDFGFYAYNFYYSLHYPNTMQGLQLLVIGNHVAIDQLLVMPFYYLIQSPLTLLLLQVVVVSLTGLLLFFIARALLKENLFALVLGTVFLLNPGVQGLIIFDYHPEYLILPFYLLTFYFYFKRNKPLFFLFLILLLATIDSVVFIVLALGLGLIYYEFVYEKDKKARSERLKLATSVVALSAAALLFYLIVPILLTNSYSQPGGAGFPAIFKAFNFDLPIMYKFLPASITNFNYTVINSTWLSFTHFNLLSDPVFVVVALLTAILVFGFAAINDPLLVIILGLPWLVALLGFGFAVYGSVNYQYFSYVIGGSAVAAMLGMIEIKKKKGLWGALSKISKRVERNKMIIICGSALILTLYVSEIGVLVHVLQTDAPFLLFDNSEFNASCYSQLNSVIAAVPANASLMTESAIFSHVTTRRYLEAMSWINSSVYFTPEYVLVDFNNCINSSQSDTPRQHAIFLNYTKNFNYSVYFRNGTATIYKLNKG
jgi:uncharacterized membrane protein